MYPAMHGVWRHWAPPLERSRLATTTFTGGYMGVVVGLPASAWLISYFHWWAPFHAFGARLFLPRTTGFLSITWAVLWFVFSSPSPATHRWISEEERQFLEAKVGAVTSSPLTVSGGGRRRSSYGQCPGRRCSPRRPSGPSSCRTLPDPGPSSFCSQTASPT